jgi:hypothetical protein
MTRLFDPLLDSVCHRAGPHSDLLPLCTRCSSVYAGAFLALLFEVAATLARRPRPGRWEFVAAACAFLAMALVGFARLYGAFLAPEWLAVFVALWFGSSVALLAAFTVGRELASRPPGEPRTARARAAFVLALALFASAVVSDLRPALRALGWAALAGLPLAFLTVHLALALVLLRFVPRRSVRFCAAAALALLLAAAQFRLFRLWRGM